MTDELYLVMAEIERYQPEGSAPRSRALLTRWVLDSLAGERDEAQRALRKLLTENTQVQRYGNDVIRFDTWINEELARELFGIAGLDWDYLFGERGDQ